MNRRALVVGIGSPHGDDRVGWEVASAIDRQTDNAIATRCARTPAELLDWLDGVEQLDVCDAVAWSTKEMAAEVGSVQCWQWPAAGLEQAPFRTSHDLSLTAVLTLAATLGRLPAQVRVWGVAIAAPTTAGEISSGLAALVPDIAQRICGELDDA
jgi:hydrogenase maturation protease